MAGYVKLGLSFTGVTSLFFVIIAYLYSRRNVEIQLQRQVQLILDGLLVQERASQVQPRTKIAVGFGACVDIIANATSVFDSLPLNLTPPILSSVQHHNVIQSRKDLAEVFSYFFQHGAAAERYTPSHRVFNDLESAALTLPHTRLELGGNAPAMGRRFAEEGCDVLLAGQMTPQTREKLSSRVKVVNDGIDKDDIHIILEYQTGEIWGDLKAPRANRFIVHSDENNPLISSLEEFALNLPKFDPHLFVIGGLQMMDNFPFKAGERLERLEKISHLMSQLKISTPIHFELASYSEEELFREIIENIVPYADSLGMNEQELPNLHSMLEFGNITLVSDPYPRVASVLDKMRRVWAMFNERRERDGGSKSGWRPLTRLHVHTLAFQAIMTRRGSRWKNTRSAAAKASLTANRYVCGSNYIWTEKARVILDDSFSTSRDNSTGESRRIVVDGERPVSCWQEVENDVEICIAPVLVCTHVRQTAGGGDNISSAGLVLQI